MRGPRPLLPDGGAVGLARLRSEPRRLSSWLRHPFRTPRPGRHTFGAFISASKCPLRLTVSVVLPPSLFELRRTSRRLRLYRLIDPATQPQGAFPHRQRAGCPHVALPRVNQTRR
jgi:hypothetical protein